MRALLKHSDCDSLLWARGAHLEVVVKGRKRVVLVLVVWPKKDL
jgi:hypothetical protein